jgi:hypothetical protein
MKIISTIFPEIIPQHWPLRVKNVYGESGSGAYRLENGGEHCFEVWFPAIVAISPVELGAVSRSGAF